MADRKITYEILGVKGLIQDKIVQVHSLVNVIVVRSFARFYLFPSLGLSSPRSMNVHMCFERGQMLWNRSFRPGFVIPSL